MGIKETIENIVARTEYSEKEIGEVVAEISFTTSNTLEEIACALLKSFTFGQDPIKVWQESKSIVALSFYMIL